MNTDTVNASSPENSESKCVEENTEIREKTDRFEIHLPVTDDEKTIVDLLQSKTGFTKALIKQVMQKGAVWVTRGNSTVRVRRASTGAHSGETLHLYYDPEILNRKPPTAQLVADETDFSIWYKPYGMLSQGSKWGDHFTISRYVEQHLTPQRSAFIVHRLDRAASGLIIIAHKKKTAATLAALFEKRCVEKIYQVIVHGKFPLELQTLDSPIDGKEAISHATGIAYDEPSNRSLLKVNIESGRKHQIRRHLTEAGFPVVGDRLYGTGDDTEDLQLVSSFLAFQYPQGQWKRSFHLPDEFKLKF